MVASNVIRGAIQIKIPAKFNFLGEEGRYRRLGILCAIAHDDFDAELDNRSIRIVYVICGVEIVRVRVYAVLAAFADQQHVSRVGGSLDVELDQANDAGRIVGISAVD